MTKTTTVTSSTATSAKATTVLTSSSSSANLKYRSSSNDNRESSSSSSKLKSMVTSSSKLKLMAENNERVKHLNLISNDKNGDVSVVHDLKNMQGLKYNLYFSSASSLLNSAGLESSSALFIDSKCESSSSKHKLVGYKCSQNEKENTDVILNPKKIEKHHPLFPTLNTSANLKTISKSKENIAILEQPLASLASKDGEEVCKYGELIVLGYNGCINQLALASASGAKQNVPNNANRRKSKYILKRRDKANGVKPSSQHTCQNPQELSVSY
jgi:hypothetical protein